jgi:hypothetical protein
MSSYVVPDPPLPPTAPQKVALEALRHEYPPPFVVGWHATSDGVVRGSLYRSVDDDEAGRAARDFTVYEDGTVQWWSAA